MQKSHKSRPRAVEKCNLKAGDIVYVWRNKVSKERKYKGLVGPGLIVRINEKRLSQRMFRWK